MFGKIEPPKAHHQMSVSQPLQHLDHVRMPLRTSQHKGSISIFPFWHRCLLQPVSPPRQRWHGFRQPMKDRFATLFENSRIY
eukprot:gene6943-biopygen2481